MFGVKFRPGAFYPFLESPLCGLIGSSVGIGEVFGAEGEALEGAILSLEDEGEMVELAEAFLRGRLPERDDNVEVINRVVDLIVTDREITRVDEAASRLKLSKRTLQRLFSRYVGVSPKWVIRRCRLQEAADRLADGEATD